MSRRQKGKAALPNLPASVRKRRCAVYTRKSTEEGLEQAFNSLDAQREACEAFVLSQRAEGRVLVPDRYDDGGVSAGPSTARRCSACCATSRPGWSTSWWSTRSTGCPAR